MTTVCNMTSLNAERKPLFVNCILKNFYDFYSRGHGCKNIILTKCQCDTFTTRPEWIPKWYPLRTCSKSASFFGQHKVRVNVDGFAVWDRSFKLDQGLGPVGDGRWGYDDDKATGMRMR